MIWDMEALPLSVTNINTIILQLGKSGGDGLTAKNMTRADLEQIKEALVFYGKIDFIFEEMNKSIQASNELILDLVKGKRRI